MAVDTSNEVSITLSRVKAAMLELQPAKFEHLGEILDVPVSIARSACQRGGDVSVACAHELKREARRYGDNTKLDERRILGEIEQAVEQEPAFIVLFDGLNEPASLRWLPTFRRFAVLSQIFGEFEGRL
ncbi:MAG: hypothetical protein ACR2RF_05600 [Geminicoccaceae bacterium]